MPDGAEGDLKALAQHQGRQIAMHVIEVGQDEEGFAPHRLETATGVDRLVGEQAPAQTVGEARGPALGGPVLAAGALAAHEAQAWRPG